MPLGHGLGRDRHALVFAELQAPRFPRSRHGLASAVVIEPIGANTDTLRPSASKRNSNESVVPPAVIVARACASSIAVHETPCRGSKAVTVPSTSAAAVVKRGPPNKATAEAKVLCSSIVDSPAYQNMLRQRANEGKLAPAVECLLWAFAKGRPVDHVKLDATVTSEQIAGWSDEQLKARTLELIEKM